MMIVVVLVLMFVCFVLGHGIGSRQTSRYWLDHATNTDGKGPIWGKGKFYYVVPESDYLDLTTDHILLEQVRLDCVLHGG